MAEQTSLESFVAFKNSFSYGSRTDLNFKFLKNLTEEEAAQFLQELLEKLGDVLDDGSVDRLVDHVIAGQEMAYAGPSPNWQYADGPFVALSKPLSAARLALITSSGHFVDGDDPKPLGIANMTQREAAARVDDFTREKPVLSAITFDTPVERQRVRHPGYDIRGAQADRNVALPIDRLRELVVEGRIGALTDAAYSFVGACAQTPLIKRTGPEWVRQIQAQGIDAALLVPV